MKTLWSAVATTVALGTIGVAVVGQRDRPPVDRFRDVNGVLVTILKVPSFIATLTMLLIGRGIILGLTGGRSIGYAVKGREYPEFFNLGETNAFGFNNQIPIALVIVIIGAFVLAKTRWGYETFATGGNEQAAAYAGIPTRWVRIRA